MTVKNFKVGQGIDLNGLQLTTDGNQLLVNGNAIAVDLTGYATQSYVTNAIGASVSPGSGLEYDTLFAHGISVDTSYIATRAYVGNAIANNAVDLSQAGGWGIDYNADTQKLDVNTSELKNSGLLYVSNPNNLPGSFIWSGTELLGINTQSLANDGFIYVNPNSLPSGFNFIGTFLSGLDYGNIASALVGQYLYQSGNSLAVDASGIANAIVWPYMSAPDGYAKVVNYNGLGLVAETSGLATQAYVANAISNLVGMAPSTLDTLQELSTALQDNPNVISTLQNVASNKQNTLIEGFGIDIYGNTIAVDQFTVANAIAGWGLNVSSSQLVVDPSDIIPSIIGSGLLQSGNNIVADTAYIANSIAGTGITYDGVSGKLTAAPGYISNVTPTFVVTNGQLDLSNTISIGSVELTDSVANVTAASDVFGNADTETYAMGSNQTVGTLPTGTEVADIFITLKDNLNGDTRTSKITAVFTGNDAPTWTEYGIITSGWTFGTTISFDSSKNIIINVDGMAPFAYSAKGVVTIIK